MIDTKQASGVTPLRDGQIWRVDDFNVQIKHVGKRLVHYQRAKGEIKRATISKMSGKQALEEYLREHNAVLVREGHS
jgi:hypothetical protein